MVKNKFFDFILRSFKWWKPKQRRWIRWNWKQVLQHWLKPNTENKMMEIYFEFMRRENQTLLLRSNHKLLIIYYYLNEINNYGKRTKITSLYFILCWFFSFSRFQLDFREFRWIFIAPEVFSAHAQFSVLQILFIMNFVVFFLRFVCLWTFIWCQMLLRGFHSIYMCFNFLFAWYSVNISIHMHYETFNYEQINNYF